MEEKDSCHVYKELKVTFARDGLFVSLFSSLPVSLFDSLQGNQTSSFGGKGEEKSWSAGEVQTPTAEGGAAAAGKRNQGLRTQNAR